MTLSVVLSIILGVIGVKGFRVEHLRHVGWQAYVATYVNWRAQPGGIPWPREDGLVAFFRYWGRRANL